MIIERLSDYVNSHLSYFPIVIATQVSENYINCYLVKKKKNSYIMAPNDLFLSQTRKKNVAEKFAFSINLSSKK